MAYVVGRSGGTWEVRESQSTPKGPRSRTLVSFRTLSDEAIERARLRATKPLSAENVREAARRAGAPVSLATADRAAGDLLRELAAGREPHPILRQLLADALQAKPAATRLGEASPLENARASAAWLTATPVERGEALHDLLLLADALPNPRRREPERFPRLERAAA